MTLNSLDPSGLAPPPLVRIGCQYCNWVCVGPDRASVVAEANQHVLACERHPLPAAVEALTLIEQWSDRSDFHPSAMAAAAPGKWSGG